MENKFLTFIKPYLSYIDKGDFFRKPFAWLYGLLAILNLIFPFHMLYIGRNIFSVGSVKYILGFLLIIVILLFAAWVSFQLWWNRMSQVADTKTASDEFVATPVFSHFVQTFGEWLGTYIGIAGFLSSIVLILFLGKDAEMLSHLLGIDIFSSSIVNALLFPIYGFLTVVAFRFIAELMRGIAAIANNTKK